MKKLIFTLSAILSLLIYAVGGFAQTPPTATKGGAKIQKQQQKQQQQEQRKKQRDEIRYYESLRNEAVIAFAKAHPPKAVYSPFSSYFQITDIICTGDSTMGDVILQFRISSLMDEFRIFMGGNRSGTRAYVGRNYYESDNMYGRIYTFRRGDSQNAIITFRNVDRRTNKFNRIDISIGLNLNILNQIVMTDMPIFWTESDQTIRNYVKTSSTQKIKKD